MQRDVYNPGLYRFLRAIVRLGLRLLWRVRVEGLERVPETGAVLLCINHISAIDPPAVGAVMRREVRFMAKIELFSYLGWLLPRIGTYPVNRDVRDSRAVRQTLRLAQQGAVIGLFPEGHRQRPGVLGQPRPGAGSLIGHVRAAVVPVAVRGPWRPFRRVVIRFGDPVDLRHSQDPAQDVMLAIGRLYYAPEEIGTGLPWAESD
ncbi:MAG: lysophospholipid acyltransferase family protein [Thermaerobacter sp.]|nr:lysophospholipid acyltransferase family protein [Thermaerobacter sp.]